MAITKPYQPFGDPGGEEYDDMAFRLGQLRADLCYIANEIDYRSGTKIVDAILKDYVVTAKISRLDHPKKEVAE